MNQKKPKRRQPNKAAGRRQNPNQPRPVRESTAGGVVWRKVDGQFQILMIQDRQGRWTIPKGHVEPGESLEQTALREIGEETGLHALKLGDKLSKIHFFYRKEAKLISMTTHVYLVESTDAGEAVVPEDSPGIIDAKWFGASDAIRLVEYRDTERLFRMALTRLQGRGRRSYGRARQRRRRAIMQATSNS